MRRLFVLFIPLLILISCADTIEGLDYSPERETIPPGIIFTEFGTRLTPELFISGERCSGNETTEVSGEEIICENNHWLVWIDDINTCLPTGECTDVEVIPVIVVLTRMDVPESPNETFYAFNAVSPVTAEQSLILSEHMVRENINGDIQVVKR